MADVNRISVKGLEELQRKAEQMVREMQGRPMVGAMRKATLLVEREAKIRAPVDTGRLRASITPSVTDRPLKGIVGSNVFYAPYQELGWTTKSGTRVEGRRYLRGAVEAMREQIKELFSKAVRRIVEK